MVSGLDNEKLLQQEGAFKNINLIPFCEIEPGYASAVPICMEFPIRSGRIDYLYGRLVLAKTRIATSFVTVIL
ncbi:hypothetical protein VCR6J2_470095 [Vibrio coralliirubri]|nr:hypothetical protein VCR6J2_470095 [Vibrio coralliirubri]